MSHPKLRVLDAKETAGPSGASKRGSHQLADSLTCPRKWFLRYRRGIRENKDKSYRIGGTLHHDAIAYAYAERLIEQDVYPTPTWWTGQPLEDMLAEHGEGWPKQIELSLKMYDAYREFWWYGHKPETWRPVAIEEQFFASLSELEAVEPDHPLADEIITCGTDLLAEDTETGILWICDHKSKGFDPFVRGNIKRMEPWVRKSTGSGDRDQYEITWQGLVNLQLLRRSFPDRIVGGFQINRFTREEPFLFDRYEIEISPRVYAEAPGLMLRAVEEELRIDARVARGLKPEPHYFACNGKYGNCDYIKLCNAKSHEEMIEVLQASFIVV